MKKNSPIARRDDEYGSDVVVPLSVVGEETNIDYPKNKCIHHLFEVQAKQTPDRIAVVRGNKSLTYRELDEKSNQFAHFLKVKGVTPDTLVGICLDRSLEIVIAILSILKAGGAYVPVDPDYPENRIEFMLADSGCPFLITHSAVTSILPDIAAELICYDKILPEIDNQSTATVNSDATPKNLAYVIYTSGSTGRPKGVMIEHRNVVRLLFNDSFQFDFNEHDVWSIFHSFCFDFSVWEMYGALLYGGKAVIISKEDARDPHAFADILIREKITVVNQTPSAFYNLIAKLIELKQESIRVRYVIFGGEKLNPGKLLSVKKQLPDIKFINMYGITETTVHVTYKELAAEDMVHGFSNIGRPIPTLKIYIFDKEMRLQPVGVEGELCVSGAGVARGYLNRDELTKEKFMPNPVNPEEIIYRSGDLARLDESGDLEYFGRMDNQVQLRGFRIELGEIESALTRLEEVEDCVVICDEDGNGEKRIVAYIVPSAKNIAADAIRSKLARQLPDYMLPAFFIPIDRLPLTDNGKLDQNKLPRPDIETIFSHQYVAPENKTEMIVAQIWGDILKIDRRKIGRNYNFFEIGGHSLAAVALVQHMREKFQKTFTLKHIYENPELGDLSGIIKQLDDIIEKPLDEIEKESRDTSGIFPMISAQLICWLIKFRFKVNYSNVCEIYGLEGTFDPVAFQKAVDRVARRHDSLWYPFSPKKPVTYPAQPTQCEVELIDMPGDAGEKKDGDLKEFILRILHKPFDLSESPLFRMTLLRRAPEKHLLLVSFPHIICDVASLNAFVREVFDTYLSAKENRAVVYQERKTKSKEIVQNEIDYFKSAKYLQDVAFWKERLEDQEPLMFDQDLILPVGKPTGRKLLAKINLNENIIADLQKISRENTTSIQLVILSLIHATLHTLCRQNDITTTMVCDIRGLCAYPPVVHLNSTVIAVRSRFSEDMQYLDLISHIKWFLVDALNHVQLPSSMIFTQPAYIFKALKKSLFFSLLAKLYIGIGMWRYRKVQLNRDIYKTQTKYMGGMVAFLKAVKRKDKALRSSFPIAFNVLPDFYEDKRLWTGDNLSVVNLRDRELTMDPRVYEEKSRFMDAILLNIDLLRDDNGQACLHLWGGRFNEKALALIREIFFNHLEKMVENPSHTILKSCAHLSN